MFSNSANSFSGTLTVLPYNAGGGGYLAINNTTALQYATVNVTANNTASIPLYGASPLLFATGLGNVTIGGLSGSASVGLTGMNEQTAVSGSDAIALTIGGNGQSTTYSGAMSGSGSLTKTGTGILALTGTNVFSGGTMVLGGSLILEGAASLFAGSDLTIGTAAGHGAVFALPSLSQSTFTISPEVAPVPEPGTFCLLAASAACAMIILRWKETQAKTLHHAVAPRRDPR